MKVNKKVLIVVDAQYDFINGNLPVPGANEAMTNLAEWLKEHANEYSFIFLTADWHPLTHCSFNKNGGQWPVHCVQHTHGAAIYQPIIDSLDDAKVDYEVLVKGDDEAHEEYSIFNNVISGSFLQNIGKDVNISQVDICGLAGNICVLNTLRDALRNFPNSNFVVLNEFSPSLDGGKALKEFVETTERAFFSS